MLKSYKTPVPRKILSKPDETMGERGARIRNGGGRKPLRSLRELADEFGISVPALSATMRHDPNGPKARYFMGGGKRNTQNTWFDPDDVRKWWKERKEKQT